MPLWEYSDRDPYRGLRMQRGMKKHDVRPMSLYLGPLRNDKKYGHSYIECE